MSCLGCSGWYSNESNSVPVMLIVDNIVSEVRTQKQSQVRAISCTFEIMCSLKSKSYSQSVFIILIDFYGILECQTSAFKNINDQIIIEMISWYNLCQYSTFYLFNLYLYAIKFTLTYKLLKIFSAYV
jgi:hypothetical protein